MGKISYPVWGTVPAVSDQFYEFPGGIVEAISVPSPRKDGKNTIPNIPTRFLGVKEWGKLRKFQVGKLIDSECLLFTGKKVSEGQAKKNKRKYDFVLRIN